MNWPRHTPTHNDPNTQCLSHVMPETHTQYEKHTHTQTHTWALSCVHQAPINMANVGLPGKPRQICLAILHLKAAARPSSSRNPQFFDLDFSTHHAIPVMNTQTLCVSRPWMRKCSQVLDILANPFSRLNLLVFKNTFAKTKTGGTGPKRDMKKLVGDQVVPLRLSLISLAFDDRVSAALAAEECLDKSLWVQLLHLF